MFFASIINLNNKNSLETKIYRNMKKAIQITLFVLSIFIDDARAQNFSTEHNHSTIDSVKIIYKSVLQPTVNPNSNNRSLIKAIPQVSISLKENSNVSKIYFKIIDPSSHTTVYSSNYSLNSTPILNESGKKLFEFSNRIIYLSNGDAIFLKSYIYELRTENNLTELSTVFSITR